MKLSDLIALSSKHGDIDVMIRDADTEWLLVVQSATYNDAVKCIEIGGDYIEGTINRDEERQLKERT